MYVTGALIVGILVWIGFLIYLAIEFANDSSADAEDMVMAVGMSVVFGFIAGILWPITLLALGSFTLLRGLMFLISKVTNRDRD